MALIEEDAPLLQQDVQATIEGGSSETDGSDCKELTIAKLQAELTAANAEAVQLRQNLARQCVSYMHIRVQSHLTDVGFTEWGPDFEWKDLTRFWKSWCPCCKRPLEITCFGDRVAEHEPEQFENAQNASAQGSTVCTWVGKPDERQANGSYAYVAALWGDDPGFALGALVLGQGLRRSHTVHKLVLLHTNDVPNHSLQLLEKVWDVIRCVEYVHANDGLFGGGREGSRFSGVFTKLQALELVAYDKIIMLDIDIVVLQNVDHLFDLPAPAALWRGQAQTKEHGFPIDGRTFFGGPDEDWGQTGGINAGVMILAPDSSLHARALYEVQAPMHPERIPGGGPEQDYLSRFFAPYWTHLSALYNFQLHHIFFALEAAIRAAIGVPLQPLSDKDSTEKGDTGGAVHNLGVENMGGLRPVDGVEDAPPSEFSPWLPGRLCLNSADVCIVHWSGETKMWHRDHLCSETDAMFVDRWFRNNNPDEARLWLDRGGSDEDYAGFGLRLQNGRFVHISNQVSASVIGGIIDKALLQVGEAALLAAAQWREDLESLPGVLSVASVDELLRRIGQQLAQPGVRRSFQCGDRVQVRWRDDKWYRGTVRQLLPEDNVNVEFDGFDDSCKCALLWEGNLQPLGERIHASQPSAELGWKYLFTNCPSVGLCIMAVFVTLKVRPWVSTENVSKQGRAG
jgi:hypothetical protein